MKPCNISLRCPLPILLSPYIERHLIVLHTIYIKNDTVYKILNYVYLPKYNIERNARSL